MAKKVPGNRSANRGKGPGGGRDLNVTAYETMLIATGQMEKPKPEPEPEKNPAAVTLGRLGGLKGGKARAAALPPDKRSAIAKKAAESRWGKKG